MLLISHKSKKEFIEFLIKHDIPYIKTIDNPNLDKRIADHPDLSLCKVDENTIVVDESVYPYYKKKLANVNIIKGKMALKKYPYDAIYNVVRFKGYYIHNNFTEENIEKNYLEKKFAHKFVRQGYTRCCLLAFNDNLLTSDYGIYKKLRDSFNISLLKEEKIDLDGFEKGFLGGCFGLINKKIAIFNGNIERLVSYDIIKNIAVKENIDLLYPDTSLLDTGSLIWI